MKKRIFVTMYAIALIFEISLFVYAIAKGRTGKNPEMILLVGLIACLIYSLIDELKS